MKNIGLVSDLHLEGSNMDFENPSWDCLIIAGDLSADLDMIEYFFSYKAPKDIPIIYVLGNHEYEGRSLDGAMIKIKKIISEFKNVHLLDNESIVIDGVKFIGSTLWSNFELDGYDKRQENMDMARNGIVDFNKNYYKNENGEYVKWTPEKMAELNKEACRFLEFELKKTPFNGIKIVVTHFAPHKNSVHPEYKNTMSSYWVNNLENLMGFSDYWVHGHTHNSFNYSVEGTKVICNPRGYSRMFNISGNKNFDKSFTIEIDNPLNNDNVLKKVKLK